MAHRLKIPVLKQAANLELLTVVHITLMHLTKKS